MTGLLTFTEADNYGALLQAFALQTALKTLGHDSIFLQLIKEKNAPEKDLTCLPHALRKKIEETLYHHKKRSAQFDKFRKQYLKISEYISSDEVQSLNDKYENFIVGSDQVWNPEITSGNPIYTLSFAEKKKRFSYAASFGGKNSTSKLPDCFWKEISFFNKISLREPYEIETVKQKTGINVSVNIDPCLLLTKDEWLSLIQNEQNSKGKYILFFSIEYDAGFYQKAKQFAEEKNLPLIVVSASYIPQFGFEAFSSTGVIQWLMYIKDATYIFCDSFHACVFSIIFEKAFMANLSKEKLADRSSRLTNLLETLGLDACQMNDNVNYSAVKQKLNIEREKSLSYLAQIYDSRN